MIVADCVKCNLTMVWRGDEPETEEDCHSCMVIERPALLRVARAAEARSREHNDTCGKSLNGKHPCSCGQDDLSAALAALNEEKGK